MKTFRNYFALSLLVLIQALLVSCEQQDDFSPAQQPDKLIQEAKAHFDQSVLPLANNATESPANLSPRQRLGRTLHWDRAYIKQTSRGQAVVVPLTLSGDIAVKVEGVGLVHLQRRSYVFIYRAPDSTLHTEVVTTIPDAAFLRSNGKKPFTGSFIVEDWQGRFIKGWDMGPDRLPRSFGAPAVSYDTGDTDVNSETPKVTQGTACTVKQYYSVYCAGSAENPNMYCQYGLAYSETKCFNTPDGGIEDGDYPASEEDGGGSGGTSPTYIEVNIFLKTPCEVANTLGQDQSFVNIITDLKGKTALNYETGYLLNKNADGSYTYTAISGQPGTSYIDFNPNSIINGFIHTHYTGTFPNFSAADIKAVFDLYMNGKIEDLNDFISGVVTPEGNSYLLSINNPQLFLSFGSQSLSGSGFVQFETTLEGQIPIYTSMGMSAATARELALLTSLEETGVTLLKGNTSSTGWSTLKKEGILVSKFDCN